MSKALNTLTNVADTNYNLSKNFRDKWSNPDFIAPYSGPKEFRTDYSSTVDGKTSFDPSIRAMQDSYLAKNDSLRSRYMGNQSAFREAMLNPMREQYAQGRGQLERSIGMRGVGGSSFGDNAMLNYDTTASRNLGDAGAQAEFNDLNAMNGLNQNDLNVSNTRLQQELAGLGLGKDQIAMLMGQYNSTQNNQIGQMNAVSNMFNAQTNAAYGWIPAANGGGKGGGSH